MQAHATALNVTALCHDPVAAWLLGHPACVVVLVVYSSLLRMSFLRLSNYLVWLLERRNGPYDILLYIAFVKFVFMCRLWDATHSESLPTN